MLPYFGPKDEIKLYNWKYQTLSIDFWRCAYERGMARKGDWGRCPEWYINNI